MRVVVTGAAGFIGSHVSQALLDRGDDVVGVDNLGDYYDPALKQARLDRLQPHPRFTFQRGDIEDPATVESAFADGPEGVVHLAAQPGVRYSVENPHACMSANITGTLNVLEACRRGHTGHLVFASSSSVYGANTAMPFSVHDNVNHPLSLYAASKKANELMAHAYSHLHGIPTTGLRFFTVYGPWGRPDMAIFRFTKAILEGRPIDVFGEGRMQRDFTYIDDVVDAVVRVLDRPPRPDPGWRSDTPEPASSAAPFRLYNVGNSSPVELGCVISAIERALGREAELHLLPMQPGDLRATCADIDDLVDAIGMRPTTSIEEGIERFVEWFRRFYQA